MNAPSPTVMPRSFGDLIALAETDLTLSQAVRRNLTSALKRFAQVDGHGPAMPCDALSVRSALKRANPKQHGISATNWRNICALVRRALRIYGAATGKSYPNLLAPDWRVLRDELVAAQDKRLRLGLSRLIHWASKQDLAPSQIDDVALRAFHHHLATKAVLPNARDRYRDTCKLWNQAAETINGWPRQVLEVPRFSKSFSLTWEQLPTSLLADLEEYCEIMGGRRPFDHRAPSSPLTPATLHSTRHAIRRLASAAILAGVPSNRLTGLAAFGDRAVLEPTLNWYTARLGGKGASLFEAVAKLVSIGRHYLGRSEDELAPLTAVLKKLNCRKRGMTPKNMERLRPFATPRHLASFINLGTLLRSEAAKKHVVRRARLIQTALAHELLLCAPMRFSNFIGLRLDRHLQLGKQGRHAAAGIQIPKDEVKNKVDLTYELPSRVAALLVDYLEHHRPLLCSDANNQFLFPGAGLTHLTTVALGERLCHAVRTHTGLMVNPHLYRHVAAFIYLQQHPGEYETVRQLLGHQSLSTTMTFYVVFDQWTSQRAFHQVLDTHLHRSAA